MTIRFPFTPSTALSSRSGPSVAIAALSEALRNDPRFGPLCGPCGAGAPACERGACSAGALAGDVEWYPLMSDALLSAVRAGRRVAIGPNVLFGYSRNPGATAVERELMAYRNYAAIFTFSRWYCELQRGAFAQKTGHVLLDYPLPRAWLDIPYHNVGQPPPAAIRNVGQPPTAATVLSPPRAAEPHVYDALIYVKGGPDELRIAQRLAHIFPSVAYVSYGSYDRARLFDLARRSRACFYLSREDHYPLAAVEIGLMGCPIISDEKSCPAIHHRLTGLIAAVRERDTSDDFTWSPDAADRLAREFDAARAMDRAFVRQCVINRHSPDIAVERIVAAINKGGF